MVDGEEKVAGSMENGCRKDAASGSMMDFPDMAQLKEAVVAQRERSVTEQFCRVLDLVRVLRHECPWDRKQTSASLAHLLLEESYELVHAIDHQDEMELKKEIGDLFLHLCFQVELAVERGSFGFSDVFEALVAKLVHRHPHVFGEQKADTEQDVLKNWEALKLKEGRTGLLDGVPSAMSELLRAFRVQKKVAGVGFDWPSGAGVLDKLNEELAELAGAATPEEREEEFGDLLFTLVNYSRFLHTNPEDALRKSTDKFIARFGLMERMATEAGRGLPEYTPEELEQLWQEAKLLDAHRGPRS